MIQQYLTYTLRNLRRRPLITFIMLFGLTISLATALVIGLYVRYDAHYDDFHQNAERIFRVNEERFVNAESQYKTAATYPAIAPQLKAEAHDQVQEAARMLHQSGIVTVVKVVKQDSAIVPKAAETITLRLKGFEHAKKVILSGTFNNWKANEIALASNGKSGEAHEWSHTFGKLAKGKYEYKFIVDGEWMTDPGNMRKVNDGKGNTNSELLVGIPQPKITLQPVKFREENIFYTDASFLTMFSFPMLHGKNSDALVRPNTVVLTASTARKYFGSENPVGQFLDFERDEMWEVTGVVQDPPPNSRIRFDFLVSFATCEAAKPDLRTNWHRYAYQTYLLLKPNASPEAVATTIGKLCDRSEGENLRRANAREVFSLQSIRSLEITSNTKTDPETSVEAVWALGVIALLLVIIAYVNYINLTTARFSERAKNMSIRKIMGASRASLVREFLTEPFLLGGVAFLLALGLVEICLPFLNSFTERSLTLALADTFFWSLVLGVILFGALVSGLYPALVFSASKPTLALKGNLRAGFTMQFVRKALVVGQFAVSIALIGGALVMNRQLRFVAEKDLGFDVTKTMIITAPTLTSGDYTMNVTAFKNAVLQLPAVRSIAASTAVPGTQVGSFGGGQIKRLYDNDPAHSYSYDVGGVDYDYLPSYGMTFLAGRNFRQEEFSPDSQTLIINETALKLLGFRSPNEAIGESLKFPWTKTAKIIGVVRDFHQASLHERIKPLIFTVFPVRGFFSVKLQQHVGGNVSNDASMQQTLKQIQAIYDRVFAGNPFEVVFLDDFFQRQYRRDVEFATLLNGLTILTIIIACLGLIGLAAFTAEQRTKEIGIRKVLGASVASVIGLLSKDFLKLVLLAIVIATPLAYWLAGKWLEDFAYRVDRSWWVFALAGAVAVVIAFVTVASQAWRTARSNPVNALRSE